MKVQSINSVHYHINSNLKNNRKSLVTNQEIVNQSQPQFKGKKLNFILDVALAGAFTAATGFAGAGLGTAYLLTKYGFLNNNNNNNNNNDD